MALAIDNGSASGTSGSVLTSALPAAESEPLADGSTAALASSGIDNPIRPASNAKAGTAEDTKAVVGADAVPAHGNAIAAADAMGIATVASMAIDSTSNGSSLLCNGTWDPSRQAPQTSAGNKADSKSNITSGRSGSKPMESTGAGKFTASSQPRGNDTLPSVGLSNTADPPSISTSARPSNDVRERLFARAGVSAGPEDEKENGLLSDMSKPKSKSRSTARGLTTSGAQAHNSDLVQLAPRGTASNAIAVAAKLSKSARTSGKGMGSGSCIRLVASTHAMSPEKSQLLLSDLALYKLLKDSQKDINDYDWKKFIPEIRQEGKSPLLLLKDSVTKLEAAVDGGVLVSSGPMQSFLDFLSREATEERLNARQPDLCNCWYSLISKIASKIHMLQDPARRKLLMPTMKVLATRLQDALGSGNSVIAANSKECMMRIASLSGLAGYSSIIAAVCDGVMQTLASRRKELIRAGCSRPFALAMAIAPDKSILRCEKQGEMISETMVTLIISKSQEVRDAGRLAYHILDSRSINGIILTIDKKLKFRSPKAMSYLRLAKDNAKVEMSEGGDLFSWIKDNGYGHFPLAL